MEGVELGSRVSSDVQSLAIDATVSLLVFKCITNADEARMKELGLISLVFAKPGTRRAERTSSHECPECESAVRWYVLVSLSLIDVFSKTDGTIIFSEMSQQTQKALKTLTLMMATPLPHLLVPHLPVDLVPQTQ